MFEVEHILPRCKGGGDDENNLALACRSCNLFKGAFVDGFDELSQRTVSLFNPRTNSWADHFEVNPQSKQLRGTTDVGRATIIRLKMNTSNQLASRLIWLKLGLFP